MNLNNQYLKRLAWSAYILMVIAIMYRFYAEVGVSMSMARAVVGLLCTSTFILGIIGYAYKIHLFNAWIWRLAFFAAPPWEQIWSLLAGNEPTDGFLIVAGAAVAMLPMFYALFQYGFRSPEIWQREQVQKTDERPFFSVSEPKSKKENG